LLAAHPDAATFYTRRAVSAVRIGRCDDAVKDLRKAIALRPEQAMDWYLLALVLRYQGHADEHAQVCRDMYAKFAASTNPFERHLLIIACLMAPDTGVEPETILELVRRPDRIDEIRLGLALY
jgi:tetratricopeptide (TPR) repeat protein